MSGRENAWERKFNMLWGGQAVSILTSSVLQMAIVWYLTQRTGSAAYLTFSTLVGFLPHAVLGTFIGVLIDRYDRKKIMILSDLVIALAGLLLAVVGIWREIPIWLIFVVLFIRSVGSAFHTPSLDAIIPSIVPRDQLAARAGYSQGFRSISMVISPVLAALLFSIWDLRVIILLDVAGAAIAMTIVWLTSIPKVQKQGHSTHVLQEAKEGFRVLGGEKGLTALMVVSALYAFIYFPIGTLYPLITLTYFGGTVAHSSVVEVVFSVGMLAGSLLLGNLGGRINKAAAISASIGLYGLGVLLTGALPPTGYPIFVALSAVMGVSVPFFTGLKTAIFQAKIPEEYLGRILSLSNSIGMIAMPLGLILAGAFADEVGVNRWFFLSGMLAMALACVSAVMPSMREGCR